MDRLILEEFDKAYSSSDLASDFQPNSSTERFTWAQRIFLLSCLTTSLDDELEQKLFNELLNDIIVYDSPIGVELLKCYIITGEKDSRLQRILDLISEEKEKVLFTANRRLTFLLGAVSAVSTLEKIPGDDKWCHEKFAETYATLWNFLSRFITTDHPMTDIPLSEPYSKFLFNEVQKINQAIWFHFPKFYQEWLEDLLEKLAQPDCNWKKIDTRQGLVHILAKSLIIRFNDLDILTVMNDWLKKDK